MAVVRCRTCGDPLKNVIDFIAETVDPNNWECQKCFYDRGRIPVKVSDILGQDLVDFAEALHC